jgi:hypothetical protein
LSGRMLRSNPTAARCPGEGSSGRYSCVGGQGRPTVDSGNSLLL